MTGLAEYTNDIAQQVPVIWMPNFRFPLFESRAIFRGVEPVSSFGVVPPKNWHDVKDCVRLRLRIANNEERKVP